MRRGTFQAPLYEADRPGPSQVWVRTGIDGGTNPGYIHAHPGIEVGVMFQGEQQISFSTTTLTCRKGDVWLVNVWEPHGWHVIPPGMSQVCAIIQPSFLGDELAGDVPWASLFTVPPEQRPQVRSMEMRQAVLQIGHAIEYEAEHKHDHWRESLRLELLRLFIELRRSWKQADAATEENGAPHTRAFLRIMPALSLIHNEPRRRISQEEAAQLCGLSPSRFHEVFRQAMGVSFSTLELRNRLAIAAHLLSRTESSIGSIAEDCGFANDSHLHRHFLRLYQCTPREYRSRAFADRHMPELAQSGASGK